MFHLVHMSDAGIPSVQMVKLHFACTNIPGSFSVHFLSNPQPFGMDLICLVCAQPSLLLAGQLQEKRPPVKAPTYPALTVAR